MTHHVDPLGPAFWELDRHLSHLAAVLPEEYEPLAQTIRRAEAANPIRKRVHAHWERLAIFGLMEIDDSRRDGVYVRRGPKWDEWHMGEEQAEMGEMLAPFGESPAID